MLPAIEEISTEEVVAPKPKMGGGINIPMPKGFKIPQGKKDGDTIEVIAKVRPMGGKLMVESLDGFELSDAEEEAMEALAKLNTAKQPSFSQDDIARSIDERLT